MIESKRFSHHIIVYCASPVSYTLPVIWHWSSVVVVTRCFVRPTSGSLQIPLL